MDVTESVTTPTELTPQQTSNSIINSSSLLSPFPTCAHRTMSSNTIYQPRGAITANSATRYRQWQILGGGFSGSYDVLLPEDQELDEEVEKELKEEAVYEGDITTFLDQIISAHIRKLLTEGK